MTSESQLEVKRKEPIDAEKFRLIPRNRMHSKFKKVQKLLKKVLDKKPLLW